MIFKETLLNAGDNSGARQIKCFQIYRTKNLGEGGKFSGCRKKSGGVLALILGSVKQIRTGMTNRKLKKSDIVTCLVFLTARIHVRGDGDSFHSSHNVVVLINRKDLSTPVGTRVKFRFPFELKLYGFVKIFSISRGVL